MTVHTNHLKGLIALAKEPSSDKRRELLREVTDLFLEKPAQYSQRETDYFGDIIGKVALEMEMTVRRTLAERISRVAEAPHGLVTQLANDTIEVAQPLLANSPVLRDTDLVAIAKMKGRDHLAAMAQRADVSETVADAIIERGDDGVLVRLAANPGARLSRGAMETMVARSEKSEELQAGMVSRKDLPPDLLNDMFFFVTTELKKQIVSRMENIDPKVLDAALADSQKRMTAELASAHDAYAKAELFISGKEREGKLNETLVITLLRAKQIPELIVAFARLTGLDNRTSRKVLFDRNAESLAIACKASKFDRATFSTIALLTSPPDARSLGDTYDLLSLYDQVPPETAQRVMRFWRVRRDALGNEPAAAAAR